MLADSYGWDRRFHRAVAFGQSDGAVRSKQWPRSRLYSLRGSECSRCSSQKSIIIEAIASACDSERVGPVPSVSLWAGTAEVGGSSIEQSPLVGRDID